LPRGICKVCESFFDSAGVAGEICPRCYEKEKTNYEIVKNYLLENKGASILEISLDTKLSIRTIKRLIDNEKIEFIND
jgi:hypothetical protein